MSTHPSGASSFTAADTLALLDPALAGSSRDFFQLAGTDLQAKARAFHTWYRRRRDAGLMPYAREMLGAPGPLAQQRQADGTVLSGLNFSAHDYLSLGTHPQVLDAAHAAMQRYGVHNGGSTVLAGNVAEAALLEQELAEHLAMPEVLLFPTGWAAGYGLMRGLVRPDDHVVMDQLAHNCLQEGAAAATRKLHQHRHLDVAHARRVLRRVRAQDPHNGVLLVTEGCYSMDADTPDLRALQALAHEFRALLVVDVAHDLGSVGPLGQSQIGLQGMLGQVDLVVGSFSKTFAASGGFVACREPALKEYLRYYAPSATFSNALSPAQVAVVRACLRIVRSPEGQQRRDALMQAVLALREGLQAHGLSLLGTPAPIVPVLLGPAATARRAARALGQAGLLANLVEYPAVAQNAARLRMLVMARHTPAQARQAAALVAQAMQEAAGGEAVETAAMGLDLLPARL